MPPKRKSVPVKKTTNKTTPTLTSLEPEHITHIIKYLSPTDLLKFRKTSKPIQHLVDNFISTNLVKHRPPLALVKKSESVLKIILDWISSTERHTRIYLAPFEDQVPGTTHRQTYLGIEYILPVTPRYKWILTTELNDEDHSVIGHSVRLHDVLEDLTVSVVGNGCKHYGKVMATDAKPWMKGSTRVLLVCRGESRPHVSYDLPMYPRNDVMKAKLYRDRMLPCIQLAGNAMSMLFPDVHIKFKVIGEKELTRDLRALGYPTVRFFR